MAAQVVPMERRQYPREGVIGQLEDIAYAAVRRYGVVAEVKTDQMSSSTQPSTRIQ